MYGDGILYSGPSAYGPELASQPVNLQTNFFNNGGGTITSANTFDTVGGNFDGITSNLSAFSLTVGTTYEIEIRGTTTSDGFTLGDLVTTGNQYGSGFGVHRFVSLNTRLWIRQNNTTGTTTITHLSIRQVTQGSDFDFTRDTSGTRINEEGYIEDVPYNLIPYSQDIDNADWDKVGTTISANEIIAPDNSLTGDKINENAGGNYHNVNHDDGVTNGTTYTVSAYFKEAERTTASIYENLGVGGGGYPLSSFNLSNGTVDSQDANHIAKISSAGSGWYRCSITFTANATRTGSIYYAPNNQLTYSGTLNSGVFMWGAQFVKSDKPKNYLPTTDRKNLPRLNYPVYGGCPSLLLEPQRINLIPYSTDFSNAAWTKNEVTVTANSIISPEGITNASLIKESSANSLHWIGDAISVTSGTSYSASVYAKKKERSVLQIVLSTNFLAASYANYDLDSGVVSATGGSVTAKIVQMQNDWYRCILSFTATATNSGTLLLAIQNSTTAARGAAYQGDGSSGLYLYGAQVEAGSYPTSLMPTSGGTFTRNEDIVEHAGLGTTNTFNSSEGVLYGELKFDQIVSGNYIGIDDGTTSNRIIIGAESSEIRVYSPSFTFNVNNLPMFDTNKIAFSWQTNLRKLFINGVKLGESTSTYTGPTGLGQLNFDSGSASQVFDGEAKAVAVYKTALTDTELANLTSYNNHDLFIPYRSRMQMISADQELQCTEHDITRFL
tara:strand:- start:65 stop:2236 length:2172 start_codon:yes stop_codon:yes gene_type:complete